ncbi:hypothetical protein HOD29_03535 [archaeon]|jgi:putative Mn2+ efflux pump MntP|nr:hypothetical protein [archaeon]
MVSHSASTQGAREPLRGPKKLNAGGKKKVTPKKNNKKSVKEKTPKRVFAFSSILAIVSIIGFLQLALISFFNIDLSHYNGFMLLAIIGIGFIIQSKPKVLFNENKGETVADITTLVIGSLAIIAGILSLPFITVNHPVVFAIPGIIAIIAIIFIVIESWIIRK